MRPHEKARPLIIEVVKVFFGREGRQIVLVGYLSIARIRIFVCRQCLWKTEMIGFFSRLVLEPTANIWTDWRDEKSKRVKGASPSPYTAGY